MKETYLSPLLKQFAYYRSLGQRSLEQVTEEQVFAADEAGGNSMAVIAKHLRGNMLSRFTDFLDSDGEKEWRDREAEFDNDLQSKDEVLQKYNEGWNCVERAFAGLTDADMERIVYIRNEGHTVYEAALRQATHYAYHIGQMVFLAKMHAGEDWQSLSIPRGGSANFNAGKFSQEKKRAHFTDSILDSKEG